MRFPHRFQPPTPQLRIRQIDDLKATVASLHAALCVDEYKMKLDIERECEVHADRVMWAGPVCTIDVVGVFMGYHGAGHSFEYPSCRERLFTKQFYKRAIKHGFDIEKYNNLVTEVEEVRRQLARIRDPLFQHLPVSYLTKLEEDATTKEEGAQTKHSPDGG
ncbi:hypothetical protein TELCIR_11078 [Teladorsagia circumcincta]|uniref:Uncharacterized protein n=1 Tax=Teladorsagia circumcincta TaxID=45464 RepID=A0A2G9UAE2_TELCI|nr:hypothetical protein TELCIR_11078 [Teladorsagia circumcincta]